jgi:exodeoxyribonuclease VII small subunit
MSKKLFEDNMSRLNEIAGLLESGNCSLENSLILYNEAVKTVKLLKTDLDEAKAAVTIMQKDLNGLFEEREVFGDFENS